MRRGSLAALVLASVAAWAQPAATPARTPRAPTLDGHLDEPGWALAPEQAGFVQSVPDEGRPASEVTRFRVLYDDAALYFGIRCDDDRASEVVARLTRRDRESHGDEVWIELDTRGDRTSAFHFEVNAAGVVRDGVRTGDQDIDFSWDAVWTAQVSRDERGWSAEVAIPFAALRFPKDARRFHLQLTRQLARRTEVSSWVPVTRTESNVLLKLGVLGPFPALPAPGRLTLIPFALGAAELDSPGLAAGGPTRFSPSFGAGVDGRWSIDSELGLDFTLLPDFGQVEADQVVMNLTTFEVEFPEKRPFFLEGADLFQLTNATGSPLATQVFYSRRLGAALPFPEVPDGVRVGSAQARQRLLGALKLTGRVGEKTTVALLDGLDGPEDFTVDDGAGPRRVGQAAAANVAVARVRSELFPRVWAGALVTNRAPFERAGALGLGGLCPSGLAAGADGRCTALATSAAADLGWRSAEGGWAAKGILLGSAKEGGPTTVLPDGHAIGAGAKDLGWIVDVAKTDGNVLLRLLHEAYGPTLDLNDGGYLRTQNLVRLFTQGCYRWFDVGPTRDIKACLELFDRESWDGVNLARGVNLNGAVTWANSWHTWLELQRYPRVFDNRELRDGGASQRPDTWGLEWDVSSNYAAPVAFDAWGVLTNTWKGAALDSGGDLTVHPQGRLELSLGPTLTWIHGDPRWVETLPGVDSRVYLFGLQQALAIGATLRATVTLTTALTVQAYAQVFSADVRYTNLFSATATGARATVHLEDLAPAGGDASAYRSQETAFNVNVVARWEYQPGSVLFLVYTHGASGVLDPTLSQDVAPRIDLSSLRRGPAQDALMLKATYRFGS